MKIMWSPRWKGKKITFVIKQKMSTEYNCNSPSRTACWFTYIWDFCICWPVPELDEGNAMWHCPPPPPPSSTPTSFLLRYWANFLSFCIKRRSKIPTIIYSMFHPDIVCLLCAHAFSTFFCTQLLDNGKIIIDNSLVFCFFQSTDMCECCVLFSTPFHGPPPPTSGCSLYSRWAGCCPFSPYTSNA